MRGNQDEKMGESPAVAGTSAIERVRMTEHHMDRKSRQPGQPGQAAKRPCQKKLKKKRKEGEEAPWTMETEKV